MLLAGIIAGVTANVAASRVPPTYESQVTLLTGPINTDYGTLRASGDLARTYADLATSGPILKQAAEALKLDVTSSELRPAVSASSNDVSRLVRIRVRNDDPGQASAIANEIAQRLTALTSQTPSESTELVEALLAEPEIESLAPATRTAIATAAERLTQQPAEGRLHIVDPAAAEDEPVAPRVSLITLLAVLAGTVGAGILILVTELSTQRLDEERLPEVIDVPLLGSIGRTGRGHLGGGNGLVVERSPGSDSARDYRLLATKIGLLDPERPTRTLLVVGADQRAGGGSVAANLATVLAQMDERVALVDANDAEGEVTRLLDLDGETGYGELVSRNGLGANLDGVGFARGERLVVLPRGDGSPNTLDVDHARRILDSLLERNDRVVLTAPTVGQSATALVWAHVADATLLVVRRGRNKRDVVEEAVRALRLAGGRVTGAVLRETSRFGSVG